MNRIVQKNMLFGMSARDQELIGEERDRLTEANPGVRITQTDAVRSLIVRASTTVNKVETRTPVVNEAA